ncbi:MAG: glycine--tRNA ligase subunit beta [Xanthomonadales bacterium]|nr:glycine--tRNA ligase subunit beta [Xanthomonadales bacterium]
MRSWRRRSRTSTARAGRGTACPRGRSRSCSRSRTASTPSPAASPRGLRPTGAKDPFALRRAAAGLARILIAREVAIDLPAWFAQAAALQPTPERPSPEELYRFTVERLRAEALQDGIPPEVFQAVAAVAPPALPDFWRRLQALAAFLREPEAKVLILAGKRIRNILRKSGEEVLREPEPERFAEPAERALWEELRAIGERAERAAASGAYREALGVLARLAGPLERFFTEVLVLCEDAALRRNRLALLSAAERPFRAIADFVELPG